MSSYSEQEEHVSRAFTQTCFTFCREQKREQSYLPELQEET